MTEEQLSALYRARHLAQELADDIKFACHHHHRASLQLNALENRRTGENYREYAVENLRKLAGELGFDLVERTAPIHAEAAE